MRTVDRTHLVAGMLFTATIAIVTVKGGLTFPFTETFAGRDLVGNYAFAELMQQNLLHGKVMRWSSDWFLGFPSFTFYPPLFFIAVAGLNLLTAGVLGVKTWFGILPFLSVLCIPLLTWYAFASVIPRKDAAFAAAYTLIFLFVSPPISMAYQVLNTGLVAQGFAYALLLPAIGLLFREDARSKTFGGILLGLTVVAHPFVGGVGGIILVAYAGVRRDLWLLWPGAVAAVVSAPWLVVAAGTIGAFTVYTLGPGQVGPLMLLLVPLAVFGGWKGARERALLIASGALAVLAYVPLPLPLQQVRFVTYLLGLTTILAGIGASRVQDRFDERYGYAAAVGGALLLAALGIVLQAPSHEAWSLDDDLDPVYEMMDDLPPGRVLVETRNGSIRDAYVLQETLPLRTDHRGVNAVHLDGSPSANYILTLEDWISESMLLNPLCRTCTGARPPPRTLDRRLDALGVRYVVARTVPSRRYLNRSMRSIRTVAGFHVFENVEGYQPVEQAAVKPVVLEGTRSQWSAVNDRVFQTNISAPLVWAEDGVAPEETSAILRMDGPPASVVERIRNVTLQPTDPANVTWTRTGNTLQIKANTTVPVQVKESYVPAHTANTSIHPASFNTLLVVPDPVAVLRFRAR